jgi:hypothetical protein
MQLKMDVQMIITLLYGNKYLFIKIMICVTIDDILDFLMYFL